MPDKIPSNPSAFPINLGSGDYSEGMTLRDYFAAKAMQGYVTLGRSYFEKDIVNAAYYLADLMLEKR